MNIRILRFIASRFSDSIQKSRFLGFAKMIALLSVMLGSMALIISLSVLNGFEKTLKDKAIKFISHLQIKSIDNMPLEDYKMVMNIIEENIPEVNKIAPVLKREGLIKSKSDVEGILIRGLNIEYDITNLKENIIEGKFEFSSTQANELIIGNSLAVKLDASVGDTLVLFAINNIGGKKIDFPDIDKFVIRGIYSTGMIKYDDIMIYIPFEKAHSFFKMETGTVHCFDLMIHNIEEIDKVTQKIDDYMGYPYFVSSYFDENGAIFAWIELQKAPIPLVLGLICMVAVLNIITILLITVVEKTHSIGILRALGMKKSGIVSIFVIQGTSIGIAGTLLGCGIGVLFAFLQNTFGLISLNGSVYFLDSLPVIFEWWHFEVVIGVSVFLSFLSTLIPSFIAVGISPMKAIRFK